MSSRNLRFGKPSMKDKGKTINLETDDEEEDLQAFVEEIEADEEMEEENNSMDEIEEEDMEEVEEEAGHVMHEEDGEEMSSPLLATKDTDLESDDENNALEEEVMLEGQL